MIFLIHRLFRNEYRLTGTIKASKGIGAGLYS